MQLSQFAPNFNTLPVESVHLVHELVHAKYPNRIPTSIPNDGYTLYLYCADAGLCHADVLNPLFRTFERIGVEALEALLGHPILRKMISEAALVKQRAPRTQKIDPRVITYIIEHNPKKPGTRAFRIWELYRVGMTADEYILAGGRRSAIRYDQSHGFIQLEAAVGSAKIAA